MVETGAARTPGKRGYGELARLEKRQRVARGCARTLKGNKERKWNGEESGGRLGEIASVVQLCP